MLQSRNLAKPDRKSAAPTTPIQLRAAREPVSTDALFSDGSSGEYEANARKRRSAETHNRKPISSLSRRLLVGAKICERYLIGVFGRYAGTTLLPAVPDLCQSLSIMTRIREPYNSGFGAVSRVTNTTCATDRRRTPAPVAHAGLVSDYLQVPQERETDHNHAHHDAINNEDFQTVGLKISNQPGNRGISNDRRNHHSHKKGHVHSRGQTLFLQFVSLEQCGARDEWRG